MFEFRNESKYFPNKFLAGGGQVQPEPVSAELGSLPPPETQNRRTHPMSNQQSHPDLLRTTPETSEGVVSRRTRLQVPGRARLQRRVVGRRCQDAPKTPEFPRRMDRRRTGRGRLQLARDIAFPIFPPSTAPGPGEHLLQRDRPRVSLQVSRARGLHQPVPVVRRQGPLSIGMGRVGIAVRGRVAVAQLAAGGGFGGRRRCSRLSPFAAVSGAPSPQGQEKEEAGQEEAADGSPIAGSRVEFLTQGAASGRVYTRGQGNDRMRLGFVPVLRPSAHYFFFLF